MGGFYMREVQSNPYALDVRVCMACGGSHNTNECQCQGAVAYGEQCADTDGLAAQWAEEALSATTHAPMPGLSGAKYLVADGHEPWRPTTMEESRAAELDTRIARKEAANEALTQRVFALEAKLEATMADAQSLQRKAADWEAESRRLSALLVETREELARRMALPARALRHGGVR